MIIDRNISIYYVYKEESILQALKKIENIDLPNARYVRSHHLEADVHFRATYNVF